MNDSKRFSKDDEGYKIPVPSKFMCEDGADTPETSPVDVSSSEIELVIPDQAVELVFSYASQDVRIATATGETATKYTLIPSGSGEKIFGITDLNSVFLLRNDDADSEVYFHFNLLSGTRI